MMKFKINIQCPHCREKIDIFGKTSLHFENVKCMKCLNSFSLKVDVLNDTLKRGEDDTKKRKLKVEEAIETMDKIRELIHCKDEVRREELSKELEAVFVED